MAGISKLLNLLKLKVEVLYVHGDLSPYIRTIDQ
ncbi:serine/threonine-protein phosphatase 6 catalytic subunit-like protein, partial [Corchorus capsularis]